MKASEVFILIFCLFWFHSAFAQKPIWSKVVLDEEITLTSLHTDTLGFIWGLSKNGLYLYDGFNLKNKVNTPKENSTFTSICSDKNYNFLIGTSDGELIQYNPYSDNILNSFQTRVQAPITYLACREVGNECLMLSYGNGVIWKDYEIDTLLSIDNMLISNEVYSAILKDDKAILATDQGIQIITRSGQNLSSNVINESHGLGDVIITNIIEHKSNVWASNFDSQVYQIDGSTSEVKIYDLPSRSKINGITMIQQDQLIVYTNNGIQTLNQDKWMKMFPEIGNQDVLDITIDKENNIWACSSGNVLEKANLSFRLLPNSIDKAQAILKTENRLWIGSSEGLFMVEGLKKTKILDKNITCLKRMDEDILVGTFSSGIIILDSEGREIGSLDGWENNPNQSVLYIYPKEDLLYVSSLTGVLKLKLKKKNGHYHTSDYQNLREQLGPGYVYQILEKEGVFYFATDRQGIKILRQDSLQHITHFDNEISLESIYSMTKCATDRVWFSSSAGYVGYEDNGEVFPVQNERFLQDPYTSLMTSADQKIIMVRNSSVDVYDPQTKHFLYYNDIKQASDQELYLNSFTQDAGFLYVAKPNAVLQIGRFENQKFYPKCIINEVMVNLIDVAEENVFEEAKNNLEFKYSAAWMTDPERITYQYMLEGLEENWRNTRDNSAVYPMLRPGKYKFRIKASIDGNFSSLEGKSYPFTIKQSFYNSWWFIALMIALLGLSIRIWRNERKKARLQKEDLNKKRTEAQLISLQSQLNPHFLFNSFNTLIGLIEENPEKGITFTEKLTDFYRSILEVGKNDTIPLTEEIELLDAYIHLIKERFGEQLKISLQWEDIAPYSLPPLTLQLLIENAVKHNVVSSKNPLQVLVKQSDDSITISNKKSPKYGNSNGTGIGLENIKKRHTLNNLKPPKIEQSGDHFIVTIYLNKH